MRPPLNHADTTVIIFLVSFRSNPFSSSLSVPKIARHSILQRSFRKYFAARSPRYCLLNCRDHGRHQTCRKFHAQRDRSFLGLAIPISQQVHQKPRHQLRIYSVRSYISHLVPVIGHRFPVSGGRDVFPARRSGEKDTRSPRGLCTHSGRVRARTIEASWRAHTERSLAGRMEPGAEINDGRRKHRSEWNREPSIRARPR